MDRSDVISLVDVTYTQDAYGVRRKTETTSQVYVNVSSVSANEFFNGGQNGLRPEYKFTMFVYDYDGQETVIYNSVRYSVYRTYLGKNDMLELYVQKDGGS